MRGSNAGIAQLVEHDLAKVGVASSSLVSRSSFQQSPDMFGALSFQQDAEPVRAWHKNWIGGVVLAIHNPLPSAMIRCSDAGIAQLVEHDLAKVGVASSSLVSRSSFQQSLGSPGFCFFEATCDHHGRDAPSNGQVAEWSCSGLQSRVRRFDSDLGLHCEQRLRRPRAPFSLA
jgi:hypothetical protein